MIGSTARRGCSSPEQTACRDFGTRRNHADSDSRSHWCSSHSELRPPASSSLGADSARIHLAVAQGRATTHPAKSRPRNREKRGMATAARWVCYSVAVVGMSIGLLWIWEARPERTTRLSAEQAECERLRALAILDLAQSATFMPIRARHLLAPPCAPRHPRGWDHDGLARGLLVGGTGIALLSLTALLHSVKQRRAPRPPASGCLRR